MGVALRRSHENRQIELLLGIGGISLVDVFKLQSLDSHVDAR